MSTPFLRAVIDAIPCGVVVIDREYRVVLANEAARALCGESDPVVKGLRCYELTHFRATPCGDDEPCPMAAALSGAAQTSVIHTHIDAVGNRSRIEVVAAPIRGHDGRVTHIVETTRELPAPPID